MYTYMYISIFSGKESIPITDILPSSSAMASFIESLTKSETVSALTLASINPAKVFDNNVCYNLCRVTLLSRRISPVFIEVPHNFYALKLLNLHLEKE